MATVILTSMFYHDFPEELSKRLNNLLWRREKIAFIASDFALHDTTDYYFHIFYDKFIKAGLEFKGAYVVDSRMTFDEAKQAVAQADLVWISGGDTPVEMKYLKQYGLVDVIRQHRGVVLGMSAGTLNLAQTTVCSRWLHDGQFDMYEGIGLVDITVESHFDVNHISDEIYDFSREHELYELCDESFIICQNGKKEFYGEVYKFTNGTMTKAGTGKVLLLGDSLRMGYEPLVRKKLEDKAYVGGPDENGRWAAYTLNSLRFWLGQFPEPDVIHWNNGLWDLGDDYQLGRPFSLPEEYESALERTITVLNKLFPKARIIMATTMPTDNPDSSDIEAYNEIIKKVARRHEIPVNDLFPIVKSDVSLIGSDHIHLTDEGFEKVAEKVSDEILKYL